MYGGAYGGGGAGQGYPSLEQRYRAGQISQNDLIQGMLGGAYSR
jgi:hypothetical protein